jgi:aspartyl/asparaginyl beta-hydroxylase (cupin superfamily)
MFKPRDFFVSFGNIVPLNLWSKISIISEDNILRGRHEESIGHKIMYELKENPIEWNIPNNISYYKPTYIQMNKGSYFLPHRDKFKDMNNNHIRLLCFMNNTNPYDYTFVIDNQIMKFEEKRWYAINTSLVHYGFCFKNETVHYACDIILDNEQTCQWLVDRVEFCDREVKTSRK